MNDWIILGIDETKDPSIVKRAYMAQLKKHNPEDDPEGFQRLREAYERICHQLRDDAAEEEAGVDDTPSGRFLQRVRQVYQDYQARIDRERWRLLLEDEACTRLDLEEETEIRLLCFLMEHYHLPPDIWGLLNRHFDWAHKQEALKKEYPVNFVDYIVNMSAEGKENAVYRAFTYDTLKPPKGEVFDTWLGIFLPFQTSVLWQHTYGSEIPAFLETAAETMAKLDEIPLRNVFYDFIRAHLLLLEKKPEEALAVAAPLADALTGDAMPCYTLGLVELALSHPDKAEPLLQEALRRAPHNFDVKRGLIECLIALQQFEDARKLLLTLLDTHPFNPFALNMFRHVTECLIVQYEEAYQENPTDSDVCLTLAKHYLNTFMHDKCRALLETYTPDGSDPRYYEYMADCLSNAGDCDRAIALYEKNIALVPKYHNYVKYATHLLDAGQNEKVIAVVDKALTFDDDDLLSKAYLYDNKGLALAAMERYADAVAAYEESLAVNNRTAHVYVHKAKACQKMNRYADAVECCEHAINLYPYITEAYTIQMEIFYDMDLYDRMLELADLAEQYGFGSAHVIYFRACALRMKGECDAAESILLALVDAEEDEGYRDYFHAELAYIYLSRADYASALESMENAIRINNEPVYRTTFLANTHRLRGAYDESLRIYNELLKKWPNYVNALVGRGNTYFDLKSYDLAIADYNEALAINENNEIAHDRLIDTFLAQNCYAEALRQAMREQQLFDNMENLLRLAWLYSRNDEIDKAQETYESAIERYADHDRPFARYAYFCRSFQNDHDKAIELFRKSLEIKPEQPVLYSDIAYCHHQEKRFEEALRVIDEGLARFTVGLGDLHVRRGLVLSSLRRHTEALQALLTGVALEAEIESRWNMAYIYNLIGTKYEVYLNDAENALTYYKTALERDEDYIDAYKNLGNLYRDYFKKYKEALKYYNQKIMLSPDAGDGYLARAQLHIQHLHLRASREDFKNALILFKLELKRNPEDYCVYVRMADCYLGMNQLDEALEYYEKALAQAPYCQYCEKAQCDEALFGIGRLYERRRQYLKAKAYYEKAIEIANSVQYNQALAAVKKRLPRKKGEPK